jgi:hypothetical protein
MDDRPSAVHSRRSLLVVTPPMYRLDIVRVIVSLRSTHSFEIPMVRDHVVIVRKLIAADRAGSSLSSHSNAVLICGWLPEFAATASTVPLFSTISFTEILYSRR